MKDTLYTSVCPCGTLTQLVGGGELKIDSRPVPRWSVRWPCFPRLRLCPFSLCLAFLLSQEELSAWIESPKLAAQT